LPRVRRIFTANSTSLSLRWRQCGCRYAIRAGRNLPDKEFRYLRTVIVTAAVYWGFDQLLRLRLQHHLTFQHRAGVTPYTSTCVFAECCVFGKQSQPPFFFDPHSLCGVSPLTLGGAPSPEVTVLICLVPSPKFSQRLRLFDVSTRVGLRYGFAQFMLRDFSWKLSISDFVFPERNTRLIAQH
jgi:hypothetical protein